MCKTQCQANNVAKIEINNLTVTLLLLQKAAHSDSTQKNIFRIQNKQNLRKKIYKTTNEREEENNKMNNGNSNSLEKKDQRTKTITTKT